MKATIAKFQIFAIWAALSVLTLSRHALFISLAQTQTNERKLVPTVGPVATWPSKSKRWAIVIGVSRYQDPQISPLIGADNDAKALRDALIKYAGFPEEHVILFSTNPGERQPTRGNIYRRFANLATFVPKDGLLLILFAGHGMEHKGQAFLFPTDAQMSKNVNILEDTAINVERMKRYILDTGIQQVVVLLDSCRDNPSGRGDKSNPLTEAYIRGFKFDVRNREVSAFATLYATAEGHSAYESSKKRMGYFTWAVVEALSGKAANEKGEVTLAGLFKYVQKTVYERVASDLGEQQQPFREMDNYKAEELVIAFVPPSPVLATAQATVPKPSELRKVVIVPDIKLPAVKLVPIPVWKLRNFSYLPKLSVPSTSPPAKPPVRLPEIEIKRLKMSAPTINVVPMPSFTLSKELSVPPPPVGAAGVPLLAVSFETIEVDARGRIKNRYNKNAWGFTEVLTNEVKLEMIEIPGGRFIMGSQQGETGSTANEQPQHEVSISSFAMSMYEITQAQWRAVASLPKVKIDLNPDPSDFKGNNLPVEKVSWEEAVEFCERLSRKTKRSYRLPSEAEWEYACRAGTHTPFYYGETITTDLVNFDGKFPYRNAPKGQYRQQTVAVDSLGTANALGLFGMHGNVMEWCLDMWHDNYVGAPINQRSWEEGTDPKERVVRGGNWFDKATVSRTAYRDHFPTNHRAYTIGFRVVATK